MNVGLAMLLSIAVLGAAYFLYGRLVARWIGLDPSRPTPATTVNDGVDYVPTKPVVLFGHHYASIAAAGPIVGPTLAALYGVFPAWAWILLGVIFIGAVHDFAALLLSVRQGGKSVAEVARSSLGQFGFVSYVVFALLLCILVAASFLGIAVEALTSHYPLADLELSPDQTVFRTARFEEATHALTGGIATVSVIVITIGAPLMGWLLYKRGISAWKGSLLAVGLCALSFVVAFAYPLVIDPTSKLAFGLTAAQIVLVVLLGYCFVAAWVPVWIILQPRDFVNVHVLYFGLAAIVLGLVACGMAGVTISAPAINVEDGGRQIGMVWPFLFVTIACGACSGAHGLICGGTSAKQLASESHAPAIGYGAMLLEALLGISVLLMIVGPMGFDQYRAIVWPKGLAVRGFALAVGMTLHQGFGLPIHYGTIFGIVLLEGFVLTTTDTIFRLSRYLLEELWAALFSRPPRWLANRITGSLLVTAAVAGLTFSNSYLKIWPVFGSANQLLAALTLIAVTAWLVERAKRSWFVAIPAAFMTVTTIAALSTLLERHLGAESRNWALISVEAVLLVLAAAVVILALRRIVQLRSAMVVAAEEPPGAGS